MKLTDHEKNYIKDLIRIKEDEVKDVDDDINILTEVKTKLCNEIESLTKLLIGNTLYQNNKMTNDYYESLKENRYEN